jgi:hypothetical protein
MRWRSFPGAYGCEMCLNHSPVLHNLYWDDADPKKGVWVCSFCITEILTALQNYRHRLTVQDGSRVERIHEILSKDKLNTTPLESSLGKEDATLLIVILGIVSIDGTVEDACGVETATFNAWEMATEKATLHGLAAIAGKIGTLTFSINIANQSGLLVQSRFDLMLGYKYQASKYPNIFPLETVDNNRSLHKTERSVWF